MQDWVKKALTRRIRKRGPHGKVETAEPNEKLVYVVKFGIAMTVCLSALEVAHIAFLGSWSSEIFAGITGLSGTVMGIFVGQKT